VPACLRPPNNAHHQDIANVFPQKRRNCWPSRSHVGTCVLTKDSARREPVYKRIVRALSPGHLSSLVHTCDGASGLLSRETVLDTIETILALSAR